MTHKNIAFIRPNRHLISDLRLEDIIKEFFSEYNVDVFDVADILRKQYLVLILNGFATLAMYGWEIFTKKKGLRVSFWRTPYIFRQITKIMRKKLKAKDYSFTIQAQSMFDASVPGIPNFIYTDHTHLANLYYPGFNPKDLFSKKWIALEKEIYNHAAKIFTWSVNINKSLIEQYNCTPEKITCVYSGSNIEIERLENVSQRFFGKRILFVGKDWKRKGGPDLISAFQLVLKKHPDAQLTIAGSAPQIDIPNCQIVGEKNLDELIPLYHNADIFCMPTLLEPFGIVFLEAMAAKLPVVATNLGALPDFIQNGWNGWLVSPHDVNGIADALSKLLDHPDQCHIYGERSNEIVHTKYNWHAVGKRIEEHIVNYMNTDPTKNNVHKYG